MTRTVFPHILVQSQPEQVKYTSVKSGGGSTKLPPIPDPAAHSAKISGQIRDAWNQSESTDSVYTIARGGAYLEVRGAPGYDLATKSLEEMRTRRSRLLNVRIETSIETDPSSGETKLVETSYATFFLATKDLEPLVRKIEKYGEEPADKKERANKNLVATIQEIHHALSLEPFWTDPKSLMPKDEKEWCELWLATQERNELDEFEALLRNLNVEAHEGHVLFPERIVKMVRANQEGLNEIILRSVVQIAEIRRAWATASYFTEDASNAEQAAWVNDLLSRLEIAGQSAVAVTILDTGVNNGHPLLAPLLDNGDMHTLQSAWGVNDHKRHGTLTAGTAAYGNLLPHLLGSHKIPVGHRLESVKIIPPPPLANPEHLWADYTSQAVSRVEIAAPDRQRILCMPVSSELRWSGGRPSSWSAQLDQLAAGVPDGPTRLFVVAAGNCCDDFLTARKGAFPRDNSIRDPGQSWNALTVGAFTDLDKISMTTFKGYSAIVPRGSLSPFTSDSSDWEDAWPIKPEIVLEGGNLAIEPGGFVSECDDLSLLSTNHEHTVQYFYPFNMTSAATAQAANMAAVILARYPSLWPETVRGLLVHSASWTDAMKVGFDTTKKGDLYRLLRAAGYGVPNLDRALHSAADSLTLLIQGEIQPFTKKGPDALTNEMHFHTLPWPKDQLLALSDSATVRMRATLSYFVEPGPGERGWEHRYRYPSHGLRFELKSPTEESELFRKRINKAQREEGDKDTKWSSVSDKWLIGSNARDRGSIHSDIWQGTAAELAESNEIAVYPTGGWWRERHHLGRCESTARYALIVSIYTDAVGVDIYTPVAVKVGVPISIST